MKATKEQIIEIGLQIVKNIYNISGSQKNVIADEEKVSLYPPGVDGYYVHNGWVFITRNASPESSKKLSYMVYLLDDGTPVFSEHVSEEVLESVRPAYIIKGTTGKYQIISKEGHFKHHNFDLTKPEFRKMKY
ncbi:MAG: hypothetical protein NTW29_14260 [Bacteroidetes bacterium]|nr:hypothetical protein [Bacteroidota bacterium]